MRKLASTLITFFALSVFAIMLVVIIRTSIFGYVEEHKHVYFEIVFLLLIATCGELARTYLKQPSVMALMVFGLLLSPSFLSLSLDFLHSLHLPIVLPEEPPEILRLDEVINVFAQLGAVILLFKIGLHNRMEKVFASENIKVAVAGVILPFIVGYGYAVLSGGNFAYSVFLGAALTATSVGVTVALLRELNLLEKRFSQIIIGAAIVDDILGLLVLSLTMNVTGGGEILMPLLTTIFSALVFVVGGVKAGDYIIKYLDRKIMSPRRFLVALAFVLFYAYIAEFIGLSAIVGAFLAGVIINRSKHVEAIESRTNGLELLFMPIFFISLGILMDVNAVIEFAVPIMVITFLAIVSKAIACAGAGLISRLSLKDSAAVGIGMVPRGEVALIVASIGLTTQSITVAEYSIISAMALITTFIVPPTLMQLLKYHKSEEDEKPGQSENPAPSETAS